MRRIFDRASIFRRLTNVRRTAARNFEDAHRGAAVVAGDGLDVVERVGHMVRAGEGIGVTAGCDIGVGEVVLVPDGLE